MDVHARMAALMEYKGRSTGRRVAAQRRKLTPPGKSLRIKRVRTPQGVKRYKQPLRSVIVADSHLTAMRIHAPVYDGYDRIERLEMPKRGVGPQVGDIATWRDNKGKVLATGRIKRIRGKRAYVDWGEEYGEESHDLDELLTSPEYGLIKEPRATGELYDLGYDWDAKRWRAYKADTTEVIYEADTEEALFIGLNEFWEGTDHRGTGSGGGATSMDDPFARPSKYKRATLLDMLGYENTIRDNGYQGEHAAKLADIIDNYDLDAEGNITGHGYDELDFYFNLDRWIREYPNDGSEDMEDLHRIATDWKRELERVVPALKRMTPEELESLSVSRNAMRETQRNTPRDVKVREVSAGMWIRLPERDTGWVRVLYVAQHSNARYSFTVDRGEGTRTETVHVSNREKIETVVKPSESVLQEERAKRASDAAARQTSREVEKQIRSDIEARWRAFHEATTRGDFGTTKTARGLAYSVDSAIADYAVHGGDVDNIDAMFERLLSRSTVRKNHALVTWLERNREEHRIAAARAKGEPEPPTASTATTAATTADVDTTPSVPSATSAVPSATSTASTASSTAQELVELAPGKYAPDFRDFDRYDNEEASHIAASAAESLGIREYDTGFEYWEGWQLPSGEKYAMGPWPDDENIYVITDEDGNVLFEGDDWREPFWQFLRAEGDAQRRDLEMQRTEPRTSTVDERIESLMARLPKPKASDKPESPKATVTANSDKTTWPVPVGLGMRIEASFGNDALKKQALSKLRRAVYQEQDHDKVPELYEEVDKYLQQQGLGADDKLRKELREWYQRAFNPGSVAGDRATPSVTASTIAGAGRPDGDPVAATLPDNRPPTPTPGTPSTGATAAAVPQTDGAVWAQITGNQTAMLEKLRSMPKQPGIDPQGVADTLQKHWGDYHNDKITWAEYLDRVSWYRSSYPPAAEFWSEAVRLRPPYKKGDTVRVEGRKGPTPWEVDEVLPDGRVEVSRAFRSGHYRDMQIQQMVTTVDKLSLIREGNEVDDMLAAMDRGMAPADAMREAERLDRRARRKTSKRGSVEAVREALERAQASRTTVDVPDYPPDTPTQRVAVGELREGMVIRRVIGGHVHYDRVAGISRASRSGERRLELVGRGARNTGAYSVDDEFDVVAETVPDATSSRRQQAVGASTTSTPTQVAASGNARPNADARAVALASMIERYASHRITADNQNYLANLVRQLRAGELTPREAQRLLQVRAQRSNDPYLEALANNIATVIAGYVEKSIQYVDGAHENRYYKWIDGAIETKDDKNAEHKYSRVMIALVPSVGDALELELDGMEPAYQLHTTITLLDEVDKYDGYTREQIVAAIRNAAIGMRKVKGQIFAANIFNPKGESPCVVLGVGGKELEVAHNILVEAVKPVADIPADVHAPWVPHITLAYHENPRLFLDEAIQRTGREVTFDRVRIAFGEEEIVDLPLSGHEPAPIRERLSMLINQARQPVDSVPEGRTDSGRYNVPRDTDNVQGEIKAAIELLLQSTAEMKVGVVTPGGRIGDPTSRDRSPKKNWVERRGGMPKYIRMVRNALLRQGHTMERATAIAVNAMKRWARGGDNVSPKVQAAAVRALARWEAMKRG